MNNVYWETLRRSSFENFLSILRENVMPIGVGTENCYKIITQRICICEVVCGELIIERREKYQGL